ncbi:YbaN family protein [Pseudoalteromonas sp. XMcav2-N-2]
MLGGYVALILAFIGAILPVMPTTVFLIIALWCFTRSSDFLEAWLLNHPKFGCILRDWRACQVIPKKAKYFAAFSMIGSLILTGLLFNFSWLQVCLFIVFAFICNYLFSKPSAVTDMVNTKRHKYINLALAITSVCLLIIWQGYFVQP